MPDIKKVGKNCKWRKHDKSRWWTERPVFVCTAGGSVHYKCGANTPCWSSSGNDFSPKEGT